MIIIHKQTNKQTNKQALYVTCHAKMWLMRKLLILRKRAFFVTFQKIYRFLILCIFAMHDNALQIGVFRDILVC